MHRLVALALGGSLFVSAHAEAYPWMVKHGYMNCAACHVDPSGAGQLTKYGRAQAVNLVQFNAALDEETGEVPSTAGFLWFADMPDAFQPSGNIRIGGLVRNNEETPVIPLLMAFDLSATVSVGPVLAHATGGFGIRDFYGPVIVAPRCVAGTEEQCGPSFVSRTHWLGLRLADDAVTVRAGRIQLPFGLRNVEHTTFVRTRTKTDVHVGQSLGVAAAFSTAQARMEVMGILGNYFVSPDELRERGYSGLAEFALGERFFIGVSSLVTQAERSLRTNASETRHAHGLFSRWVLSEELVLLTEANVLAELSERDRLGVVAFGQVDYEPVRGLHLIATLEAEAFDAELDPDRVGVWLGSAWYPLPHIETRLDGFVRESLGRDDTELGLLIQVHAFL